MKEVSHDYYVFEEAEKAEKAIKRMRKAIGKENETDAAVKFAHAMLDLYGERMTVKNETIQSRIALLNTYYKINTVRNEIQNAVWYATTLAGEVYNEYRARGGDHFEEEAYRTRRSIEEVRETYLQKPAFCLIETRDPQAEEKIKSAEEDNASYRGISGASASEAIQIKAD